jgi:hypothetical protein
MPPRDFTCYCKECTKVGGLDTITGKARGVTMPTSARVAHLKRVKEARQQAIEQEVQSVTASVMALALTDEGPDMDSQPNRLFVSRQEYQSSVRAPALSTDAAVEAIAQSLQRLHVDAKNLPMLTDDVNSNVSNTLPSQEHAPSSKMEQNHKTQVAKQRLDVVESRIHQLSSRFAVL